MGLRSHAFERVACLALAKTEATKGTEYLRIGVGSDWVDDAAVGRAVGVAEDESGGDSAFDDELPSVLSSVVSRAQRDERVGIVIAAFGAQDDVVEVEKNCVAAAGHHAPSVIASHDFAAHGGWDVLVGASALGIIVTHVGGVRGDGADMLGVAARHLYDVRVDLDLLAPSLLPAAVALAADRDRDLVTGSALVGGTAEDVARHEKEAGVFVERFIGFTAELGHGFAEGCESFGGDLHAQDVSAERGIGRVTRLVAGLVTRHELLDLAERSTPRGFEPCVFVLGSGNAGELARCGPWDGPVAEGVLEMGQGLERLGDAEAFFDPAWAIAEESLDVLGKAGEAEMQVNIGAQGPQERAAFFPIEARSFLGDAGELIVGDAPIEWFGDHSLSVPLRFWSAWLARSEAIARQNLSRGLFKERTLPWFARAHRRAITG